MTGPSSRLSTMSTTYSIIRCSSSAWEAPLLHITTSSSTAIPTNSSSSSSLTLGLSVYSQAVTIVRMDKNDWMSRVLTNTMMRMWRTTKTIRMMPSRTFPQMRTSLATSTHLSACQKHRIVTKATQQPGGSIRA